MITPNQAVERGALWLDEHHPGWWRRIDIDTFDYGDSSHCICGQLFAEQAAATVPIPDPYTLIPDGFEWFAAEHPELVTALGFSVAEETVLGGAWDVYERLWLYEIHTRQLRAAATQSVPTTEVVPA